MQQAKNRTLNLCCPNCGNPRVINIPEQFENWPDTANQLWFSVAEKTLCSECEKQAKPGYVDGIKRIDNETRMAEWEQFCPAMYRKTDPDHIGLNFGTFKDVMGYSFDESGFLIIEGSKRNGKSRSAFSRIKIDFLKGRSAEFIQGCNFRSYVKELNSLSIEEKQSRIKQPYFILFDDLQDSLIASSSSDWLLFELNTILKTRQVFERKTIVVLKSPPSKTNNEIKQNYQKIREFLEQYADLSIDFDS